MSEGIFENFIDTLGAAFLEWVVFLRGMATGMGGVLFWQHSCFGNCPICERISSRLVGYCGCNLKATSLPVKTTSEGGKLWAAWVAGWFCFVQDPSAAAWFSTARSKIQAYVGGTSSGAQRKHFNKFIDSLRALQLISVPPLSKCTINENLTTVFIRRAGRRPKGPLPTFLSVSCRRCLDSVTWVFIVTHFDYENMLTPRRPNKRALWPRMEWKAGPGRCFIIN